MTKLAIGILAAWIISLAAVLVWHFASTADARDSEHVLNEVLTYCVPLTTGENEACDILLNAYIQATE